MLMRLLNLCERLSVLVCRRKLFNLVRHNDADADKRHIIDSDGLVLDLHEQLADGTRCSQERMNVSLPSRRHTVLAVDEDACPMDHVKDNDRHDRHADAPIHFSVNTHTKDRSECR